MQTRHLLPDMKYAKGQKGHSFPLRVLFIQKHITKPPTDYRTLWGNKLLFA